MKLELVVLHETFFCAFLQDGFVLMLETSCKVFHECFFGKVIVVEDVEEFVTVFFFYLGEEFVDILA